LDCGKYEVFYHLVLREHLVALLALALDALALALHYLWLWPWLGGLGLGKAGLVNISGWLSLKN